MKYIPAVLQLCTAGLLALLCIFTPSALSYLLVIALLTRVFLFLHPTKCHDIHSCLNSGNALLVIDMQEDLCGSNGCYRNREVLIRNVNDIMEKEEKQGHPIIYIRQEFHRLDFLFCFLAMGGRLLEGTKGALFCPGLHRYGDTVFLKHQQDSFSCKELDRYLKKNHINTITLVGLDVSGCILKTALGAAGRGYHVDVIEDGVTGRSERAVKKALHRLSQKGITIC